MTVARIGRAALLIAATLVGCGASQSGSSPSEEEEARVAAHEVAAARFPDCPDVRVTPVHESARCVRDTPVERWAMDENGDFVGDGCAQWEGFEIAPGARWMATGCGRTEVIYCGGCDGSMSTCYDESQVGVIHCAWM